MGRIRFAQVPQNSQTYSEVYDERSLAAAELYQVLGRDRWHQIFLDTTVFDDPSNPLYQWQSHNRCNMATDIQIPLLITKAKNR